MAMAGVQINAETAGDQRAVSSWAGGVENTNPHSRGPHSSEQRARAAARSKTEDSSPHEPHTCRPA